MKKFDGINNRNMKLLEGNNFEYVNAKFCYLSIKIINTYHSPWVGGVKLYGPNLDPIFQVKSILGYFQI